MSGLSPKKRAEIYAGYTALHATAAKQLDALESEAGLKPVQMSFTSIDGQKIDLQAMKGKIIIIDFWASWCKPCVAELPRLEILYTKYKNKGLEIIGICLDEQQALPKVQEILKKYKVVWPQRFEGKGLNTDAYRSLYGISSLPTVWVLDREGKVISRTARGEVLDLLIEEQLR